MHSDDLYTIGKELLGLSQRPAYKLNDAAARSGVSRLYYHVYHVGLYYANLNDYGNYKNDEKKGVHEKLWAFYKHIGRTDIADLATELKLKRHAADYELDSEFNISPNFWIELTDELREMIPVSGV